MEGEFSAFVFKLTDIAPNAFEARCGGKGPVEKQVSGFLLVPVKFTGEPVVEEAEVKSEVKLGSVFPSQFPALELCDFKACTTCVVDTGLEGEVSIIRNSRVAGNTVAGSYLKVADHILDTFHEVFLGNNPACRSCREEPETVVDAEPR